MGRVLFDLQVFAEQAQGGVSRYFSELARHLEMRGNWRAHLPGGVHVAGTPAVSQAGRSLRSPPIPRTVRLYRAANRAALRLSRPHRNVDLYHPTWYDAATIRLLGDIPYVITVHDLIPESWPDVTDSRQLADRAAAVRGARRIICVSHTTLERLRDHYGQEAAAKAHVAHLGISRLSTALPDRERAQNFVYVGHRGSYKDFTTLVRALSITPPEITLTVVGGGAPSSALMAALAGMESRVRFEPRPSDARLAQIISESSALISTSLDEGFGLPPLEALSLRTPVIITDIPVYREIYEGLATFFPARDPEALSSQMIEHAIRREPSDVRIDVIESRFSWMRNAEITERVYDQAVEH